jgi:Asp-tRNA(Asn)/Glu-tRNA(Gln) amidotransferase B subunit
LSGGHREFAGSTEGHGGSRAVVGQVMKSSGGKANPQAVNDLLKAKLGI